MYVYRVEMSSQNLYLFLIVMLFIILIEGQYRDQMNKKINIEGFDGQISAEAIQNISSMFEEDLVTLPNLKLTGNLEVTGTTTLKSDMSTKNVVTDGQIQIGTDPKKSMISTNGGTYWKSDNKYTWTGVSGFTTTDGSNRSDVFPTKVNTSDLSVGSIKATGAITGDSVTTGNSKMNNSGLFYAGNSAVIKGYNVRIQDSMKDENNSTQTRYLSYCNDGDGSKCGGSDPWASWDTSSNYLKIV